MVYTNMKTPKTVFRKGRNSFQKSVLDFQFNVYNFMKICKELQTEFLGAQIPINE